LDHDIYNDNLLKEKNGSKLGEGSEFSRRKMRSVPDVRMDTQVVCIIASKIVACFFLCSR
jgi:hypothetical protein